VALELLGVPILFMVPSVVSGVPALVLWGIWGIYTILWIVMLVKSYRPVPRLRWFGWIGFIFVNVLLYLVNDCFFRPFVMPTGSMQPTLCGIDSIPDWTSVVWDADFADRYDFSVDKQNMRARERARLIKEQETLIIPTGWERIKQQLEGVSYIHVVASSNGSLDSIGPVKRFLRFNIKQSLKIGGAEHVIWFPPDLGESGLRHRAGLFVGHVYHKGDDVVKLRVRAADRIFVERCTYIFRSPKRGDIVVFETKGIPKAQRETPSWGIPPDEFFVKRIAGIPGDVLSIQNGHLYNHGQFLSQPTNLAKLEFSVPPAIQIYLTNSADTFRVPDGCYFFVGDNTTNSLDSRYWGAVSGKYIIGKVSEIYWPFARAGRVQ